MLVKQIKRMIEGPEVKEYVLIELANARKKYVESRMLKDYYDNMSSYYEKKINTLQNTLKNEIHDWEKYDNNINSLNTNTKNNASGILNYMKAA